MLILDASGSMWAQLPEGRSRIEVARDVLDDFLRARQPSTPLGVIAYGHNRKGDCSDIAVIAPVAAQDGAALGARLRALSPRGKTPIADALRLAAAQIPPAVEEADIVLVTDGLETCGGDPCAVAAALARSGIPLRAHVVGFGLSEGELQQIACGAKETGGLLLSTQSGTELSEALLRTTSVALPAPLAPGIAAISLTIRADIAGRPARVAFRAVEETRNESLELGMLDFTLSDSLPVELTEGTWLITADAGDLGNGELVTRIVAGDNRTVYVPFRGILPTLDLIPPVGAMRAGASGIFPHRITSEGLSVGGADFQLTLLPSDAATLDDRALTWSAQDGRQGAYVSQLNLPAEPGRYLVAYHRYGETDLTKALALFPLEVAARPDVTLIAPDAVETGAAIPVTVIGGMSHADRIEVWKEGQLYGWDQSLYMQDVFDNVYGAAKLLPAPSKPGQYELVYLFSDLDTPDNIAARQPLLVGRDVTHDEAALTPGADPARCDDDTGCGMGEDAPLPGAGVTPVRITAAGFQDRPVAWLAQPVGRDGELPVDSGGPVTGPWATTLDQGTWALTGIAEGATFFGQIEVNGDGLQNVTLSRAMPGEAAAQGNASMVFTCMDRVQCVFEDTDIGILAVIPSGWAVETPTREAAVGLGERGSVRMSVIEIAQPDNAIVLNPSMWIDMNGPCNDVQAGQLCHFAPANDAMLAALDMIGRSIRDTRPRNLPGPAAALDQILGNIAKDDPAAAAAMQGLIGASGGTATTGAEIPRPVQGQTSTPDQSDQLPRHLKGN